MGSIPAGHPSYSYKRSCVAGCSQKVPCATERRVGVWATSLLEEAARRTSIRRQVEPCAAGIRVLTNRSQLDPIPPVHDPRPGDHG